jgi:hypothetical protein
MIRPVHDPVFSATAHAARAEIFVQLLGTADFNVKTDLDRFLRDVHRFALETWAIEVFVTLRSLVFMDSSCLKSLSWWVRTVGAEGTSLPYRLTFVADPSARWQRHSIGALVAVAGPGVSLVYGAAA